MKRFAPACFAAITMGSNASRLIDVESFSSSSKLASFGDACQIDHRLDAFERTDNFLTSRMSPLTILRFGLFSAGSPPRST